MSLISSELLRGLGAGCAEEDASLHLLGGDDCCQEDVPGLPRCPEDMDRD